MKPREYRQLLLKCLSKGKLDLSKIVALTVDEKNKFAHYIISNRGPVIKELTVNLDKSWLASMGYMYETKGKLFTFIHTAAHEIR